MASRPMGRTSLGVADRGNGVDPRLPRPTVTFDESVRAYKKRLLVDALVNAKWIKSRAARSLGMSHQRFRWCWTRYVET